MIWFDKVLLILFPYLQTASVCLKNFQKFSVQLMSSVWFVDDIVTFAVEDSVYSAELPQCPTHVVFLESREQILEKAKSYIMRSIFIDSAFSDVHASSVVVTIIGPWLVISLDLSQK